MQQLYNSITTKEYQQYFDEARKNSNNQLEIDQIVQQIQKIIPKFDKQTTENVFYLFNPSCNYVLNQDQFVRFAYVCNFMNQQSRDLQDLMFIAVDENMDEKITTQQLDKIYEYFGLNFDEQLKQELAKENQIDYEQYRRIMELIKKAFNE